MGNKPTVQGESKRELTPDQTKELAALVKAYMKPDHLLDLSHQENLYDKCLLLFRGQFTEFKRLNLAHNIIADQISKLIGQMELRKLESLQMDNCGLTDQCLEFIVRCHPSSLSFLYLNSNRIGAKGAKVLSKLSLTHLKTLDLTDNLIDDEAAAWIAKGTFIELNTLQLAKNKITSEGAIALSNAEWPMLVYVNLSGNAIEPGRKAQVETLKFKTKLKGMRIEV